MCVTSLYIWTHLNIAALVTRVVRGLGLTSIAVLSTAAILPSWRTETRSSSTAPLSSFPWLPTDVSTLIYSTQLQKKVFVSPEVYLSAPLSLILTIFQTFTSCHNVSRMGHGPLLMSAVYLTPLHWCSPTGQPSPSASSASSSSSSQSLSAGPGVTQAASLTQSLAL